MRKVLLFAVVSVALVGCKSGPSLVGSWTGTGTSKALPPGASIKFDFTGSDITLNVKLNMMGKDMTMMTKGTYTLVEGKFTPKFSDSKLTVNDPAIQKQIDAMNQQNKATQLDGMNKGLTGTVVFKDADHATIKLDKESIELTRATGS